MPTVPSRVPVHGTVLRGLLTDRQSRCVHYAGPTDVVALQLACCPDYWACRRCHDALAGHEAVPTPLEDVHREPALCGVCGRRMRTHEYLAAESCPSCGAGFNPGCRLHRHLYFSSTEDP